MSIQLRERTLDVWDGAQTLHNARIHESVLCLAPQELAREELNLIAGDARIITSVEEGAHLAESGHTSVVVFAAGLDLARGLLQCGILDGTRRIHWHLGLGPMDTLAILASLELPFGVRVEGINHAVSGTVVTTGLTTGGMLDTFSFHRGVQAGSRHGHESAAAGQTADANQERLLQEKLLHTLQTVAPLIAAEPACEREHDEAAEKQLVALQRKFDPLERKYAALAGSHMGKLTLRLWAGKRALKRGLQKSTNFATAPKTR